MTTRLNGSRILLTGVSRGVGLAAARVLIGQGAQLLGIAREPERLAEATAELDECGPGTFASVCADLSAPDAPGRVAAEVEQRWGALDIVVNNAGVMLHKEGGVMAEPDGVLESSLDVNLLVPLRLSRAVLPLLRKGNEPRIINVGSGAGTLSGVTEPGIGSYRLSKWAVHGLTMLQAAELAGVISVVGFDPGWVRTDLGGSEAPGTVEEAAQGLLEAVLMPWNETGCFVKDGVEIPW